MAGTGRIGRRGLLPLAAMVAWGLSACEMADPFDVSAEGRTFPSGLAGATLYVEPETQAGRQAELWRDARPADALLMERVASEPQAIWLNGGTDDASRVAAVLTEAAGRVPVFVVYNIPNRDCGPGGAADRTSYLRWLDGVADALRGAGAVVVLEPDALAGATCLGSEGAEARYALLAEAGRRLEQAGARVYLDAGHPRWQSAAETVARLRAAAIEEMTGFAVNVANTVGITENVEWGSSIASQVARGFVIDTGRSGAGAQPQWCNPPDAALGASPTTVTAGWVDALLWIKRPGESDGLCNGGPGDGTWWPEYALALARAAE